MDDLGFTAKVMKETGLTMRQYTEPSKLDEILMFVFCVPPIEIALNESKPSIHGELRIDGESVG